MSIESNESMFLLILSFLIVGTFIVCIHYIVNKIIGFLFPKWKYTSYYDPIVDRIVSEISRLDCVVYRRQNKILSGVVILMSGDEAFIDLYADCKLKVKERVLIRIGDSAYRAINARVCRKDKGYISTYHCRLYFSYDSKEILEEIKEVARVGGYIRYRFPDLHRDFAVKVERKVEHYIDKLGYIDNKNVQTIGSCQG